MKYYPKIFVRIKNEFSVTHILICVFISFLLLPNIKADSRNKIYVIVNNSVKEKKVTRNQLKRIFLGKKRYLHGMPLKVYFLPLDSAATNLFCKEVLQVSPSKFKKQLKALTSSGRISIPKKLKTPMKMILKISNKKGAIGYVSKEWVVVYKNRFFHRLKIKKE